MKRVAVTIAVTASVALLGLAGCERVGGQGAAQDNTSTLSWAGQALQSIGFTADEIGAGDPSVSAGDTTEVGTAQVGATPAPSTRAGKGGLRARFKRLRFAFGQRMLHGEAVVNTDEGTRTVVVQRGQVSAVNGTTVTVTSSDGYAITWTLAPNVVVVKDKTKADTSAVTVGAMVGVAGAKDGTTTSARLVVITPR